MTKKRARKPNGAGRASEPARERLLKVWLTDQELKLLKVAAALKEQRPAEFARTLIAKGAQAVTEAFKNE